MCSPWVLTATGLMPCTTCGGRRSWARSTRRSTHKRRAYFEGSGGLAMTFEELLDQAIALLQRRGRLTYRALKRQFNIDDDYLEDLKAELIQGQRLAVDEDGAVLVWRGDTALAAAPTPMQAQAPPAYTPKPLADKHLTSRSALE